MPIKKLHVAAAQIHSGGGPRETLQRLERQVRVAAAVGVDVLLFSECVLQGYDYDITPEQLQHIAVSVNGRECDRIVRLAQRHKLAILAGFFERDGDMIYNSVLVAQPDGTRQVERKFNLTPGEIKAHVAPGKRVRTIFEFNGVKCIILICADGGMEKMGEHLREIGAEYRFCPTGGGGKLQDYLHESDLRTAEGRKKYIENRPRVFNTCAILENQEDLPCGFTSANALGPVGAQTCHQGHCMIVDNNHVMRAQLPGTIVLEHQQDQLIHATLNFES